MFQSEKPLIHIVKPAIESLLVNLAKAYMNADYVDECACDLSSLDPSNRYEFVRFDQVYLGNYNYISYTSIHNLLRFFL